MTPLIYPLPGGDKLAADLAAETGWELGATGFRRFPDGESWFRLEPLPDARPVILAGALNDPDARTVPMLLMAAAARELGASRVLLAAPYLAYMRQDISFHPGEPVNARHYARLLSAGLDGLVTVDPHLHRIAALEEVYTIPTRVLHAAPLLAEWIGANVRSPLVVGPDEESAQWVREVAEGAAAPFTVMRKERLGDRQVRIEAPDLTAYAGRTPVLVDDMASSGRTLVECAARLRDAGFDPRCCVVVHALAGPESRAELARAGLTLISTESVPHPSNAIPIAPLLARGLRPLLED